MVFPRSPEESLPQAPGNRRRRRRRASPEDAQRQSERRALDTRRQKIAIGIGIGLILVVLGIVGVGYYLEFSARRENWPARCGMSVSPWATWWTAYGCCRVSTATREGGLT